MMMKLSKAFQQAEEAAREHDAYWAETLKIEFAMAMEKQRRMAGISYSQIAEKIKTSAAYITKIFRGESNLTIESMVKLARAVDGCVSIEIVDKTHAARKWDVAELFHKQNRAPIFLRSGVTYTNRAVNDPDHKQAA